MTGNALTIESQQIECPNGDEVRNRSIVRSSHRDMVCETDIDLAGTDRRRSLAGTDAIGGIDMDGLHRRDRRGWML